MLSRFAPLLILLAAILAAYALDLHTYLSLAEIKAHKEEFKEYIEVNPIFAPLIFMGIYIFSVALSLPVATLLSLLSGFLFGLVFGTLYVITSATIGASIIFLVAKTSMGEFLRKRAGKFYKKIESNMKENAISYLLFMRLMPIFPFLAVNIVSALFNVPLRIFALTTFFGIIPVSSVYVYFGQQLGEIDSLSELASPKLLLVFILISTLALIPTLYKQYIVNFIDVCER